MYQIVWVANFVKNRDFCEKVDFCKNVHFAQLGIFVPTKNTHRRKNPPIYIVLNTAPFLTLFWPPQKPCFCVTVVENGVSSPFSFLSQRPPIMTTTPFAVQGWVVWIHSLKPNPGRASALQLVLNCRLVVTPRNTPILVVFLSNSLLNHTFYIRTYHVRYWLYGRFLRSVIQSSWV